MAVAESGSGDADKSLANMTTHSAEAYRYYLEGIELSNKLFRLEAKAKFLKAIELDSTFAWAYRSLVVDANGTPLEDSEWIAAAVRHADNASPLQRRHIFAVADAVSKRYEEALAQYKELIREYPHDLQAYRASANILMNFLRRYEDAIPYHLKIIELNSDSKQTYNLLAYTYKRLRQLDKSLEWIDKYVALVPNEPNPYDSRGEILADAGRIEESIASYKKALEIAPEFYAGYANLSWVYLFTGDYMGADSCIDALIRCPHPQMRAWGRHFQSFQKSYQGKFRESLQILSDGISADRLDKSTPFETIFKHAHRGWQFSLIGQYDSSLYHLKFAADSAQVLSGQIPGLYFRDILAVVLAKSGRHNDALKLARELKSQTGDIYTWEAQTLQLTTGEIFLEINQSDSAIAYIEPTLKYAGDVNPYDRYLLGRAYLAAERTDDAIEQLSGVTTRLEEVDWSPIAQAHYQLGIAYEQQGNNSKAVEHLEIFLDRWKDADEDLPDLIDGKARLKRLKSTI